GVQTCALPISRTGGHAIADLPGDGTRRCPGVAGGAGEESLDDLRPGREPRADPDPDANAITNANAHAVTNVNADAHAKPNTSPNDGACSSSSGRLDWLVLTGWRVVDGTGQLLLGRGPCRCLCQRDRRRVVAQLARCEGLALGIAGRPANLARQRRLSEQRADGCLCPRSRS